VAATTCSAVSCVELDASIIMTFLVPPGTQLGRFRSA
jgi:hypothetical protein